VALAVDEGWVYWAVAGPDGSLLRAPLEGGDAEVLARGLGYPQGRLVVDDRQLYVVTAPDGLFKLPKDGDGPVELVDAVAYDAASAGAEIYWSTGPTLLRAPSASGPATTILQDLSGADVVALDGEHIYWVDRLGGELYRAGRDGQDPSLLDSMVGDSGPTITLDDAHVYWGVNGQLARVDKVGGAVLDLAPEYGSFGPAVTDGRHVYGLRRGGDATAGAILTLPVEGGQIRSANEGIHPTALALDDSFLYWADVPDAAPATIRRAAK